MKYSSTAAVVVWALMCAVGPVAAQTKSDFGKEEFESKCISCHGVSGKGDGPLSRVYLSQPTDLTTLVKRNGGVFPTQRVFDVIDGQQEVAAHGPRTMPVWGRDYQKRMPDLDGYFDLRTSIAQAKILALIDYLSRIQEKK